MTRIVTAVVMYEISKIHLATPPSGILSLTLKKHSTREDIDKMGEFLRIGFASIASTRSVVLNAAALVCLFAPNVARDRTAILRSIGLPA